MKTIKLFTYALLVMSVIFTACSAEDGADGLDGQDGATGLTGADGQDGQDGADGQDGTDGEDGDDGNANVSTFIFDISGFSGNNDAITVSEITQDVIENDVFLLYVTQTNSLNNIISSTQVPGIVIENGTFIRYNFLTEILPGDVFNNNLFTEYYTLDGTPHNLVAGNLLELKVIIIESTSTTGRSSAFTKESVLAELEAAGVDTNNYDDVIAYYGL